VIYIIILHFIFAGKRREDRKRKSQASEEKRMRNIHLTKEKRKEKMKKNEDAR
jgi:hypothetical protein